MKSLTHSVITLTIASLLTACDSSPKTQTETLPVVIASKVIMEKVSPTHEFIGRTEASEDVMVNSRVSGLLLAREFTEGGNVTEGDVLFQIDPDKENKAVSQQQALLKQRQAANNLSIKNFNRGKNLVESGAISGVDYDELETRKIESLHKLEETQSTLDEAKLNLSYTTVIAPISGRVGKALVSEGDLVTVDRQMVNLVQLDPIRVSFQISESILNKMQQLNAKQMNNAPNASELAVRLRFSNGEYYQQIGHIDFIDNRVDTATGTLNVRASFSNPTESLLPGQFVKVEISNNIDKQALLIPQQAVQEDQEGRFVMAVNKDSVIEKRLVQLGARYGIRWEVKSGLKEGDSVVIEGLQKIRQGLKVTANYNAVLPFSKNKSTNDGKVMKPIESTTADQKEH